MVAVFFFRSALGTIRFHLHGLKLWFPVGSTTVFSPNVISTPVQAQYNYPRTYPQQQQPAMPMDATASQPYQLVQRRSPNFEINSPFVYSAKHAGLYLYLGRILRPIWNLNCVQKVTVDSKKTYVSRDGFIGSLSCRFGLDTLGMKSFRQISER